MEYHCLRILFNENQYFLIWKGNSDKEEEKDKVLVSKDGLISHRETYKEISEYAQDIGVELRGEPITYDLDRISDWIRGKVSLASDELINTWNFFLDASASFPSCINIFSDFSYSHMSLHKTLSLLSISNLLRKEKAAPISGLSSTELQSLKELMRLGLDLIRLTISGISDF